jgi:hypothetical protein
VQAVRLGHWSRGLAGGAACKRGFSGAANTRGAAAAQAACSAPGITSHFSEQSAVAVAWCQGVTGRLLQGWRRMCVLGQPPHEHSTGTRCCT